MRPKSKMSAGVPTTGLMSVHQTQKQLLRKAARRAYSTDETGSTGDAKNAASESQSNSDASAASAGSSPSSAASGAGAKKPAGTSSTLSNLENLYAAFAKQQKDKAKSPDGTSAGGVGAQNKNAGRRSVPGFSGGPGRNNQMGAGSSSAPRGLVGDDDERPVPTNVLERDAFYRDVAARIEPEEGVDTEAGFWGFMDRSKSSTNLADAAEEGEDSLTRHLMSAEDAQDVKLGRKVRENRYRPGRDDLGVSVLRRKPAPLTADEEAEESLVSTLSDISGSVAKENAATRRAPKTFADLRAIEEERAIAAGQLDPTSPHALEMKKRNQAISPRSDNEAQTIEQTLISRHRAAVEQVSHVERELDISTTVPGMAPLTHAQNPYLYNEAYAMGLTTPEMEWLSERDSWKALVAAKHTNIALQQRDLKEDRELVDELFIKVVNQLTQGPSSAGFIHPEDIKAQHAALEARGRLQKRLWEIYNNSEVQWATLLHKYLPTPEEDGLARNVFDRDFWNPSNPWLLTAFTKQLVSEAEYMDKMTSSDTMEEEISERLIDQGHIREDMNTDEHALGPLGEQSGISAEEDVKAQDAADEKAQHMGCLFCSTHRHRFPLEPMNVPLLARHMTTNGTILPRSATGLCKRHQAKMSRTIKQARHMNLFTYKKSLYRINNVFKDVSTWTTPDLDNLTYTTPQDIVPPTSNYDAYAAEEDYYKRVEMTMEQAYEFGAVPMDAAERGHYDHLLPETEEENAIDDMLADPEESELITERLNENIIDHSTIAAIEAFASTQAAERARLIAEGLEDEETVLDTASVPAAAIASHMAQLSAKEAARSRLPRDMMLRQQEQQSQIHNKAKGKRGPLNAQQKADQEDDLGTDMVNRALSKNIKKTRYSRDSL